MPIKADMVAGIADNLRRIFQVVNEHSKRAERETGLTGPQLWAVKVIADSTPIKVSDIASRMYLHPATVGGILDRLEARDLVARTRSIEDRRVVHLDLTEKGRELVDRAPEVAQGLVVSGLERLSRQKVASVAKGLEDLIRILGAQATPAQLLLSPEVNVPVANGRKRTL